MRDLARDAKRLVGRLGSAEDEVRADGGEPVDTQGSGPIAALKRNLANQQFRESMPFWLPAFLLMALFVYGAIIWNFMLSLTDPVGLGSPDYSDLDFDMYVQAFTSDSFVNATVNTFVLLVAFTLVSLVLGLVVAILVDRNIRFENTFRTIYLLPMSLSFVVTAQFWLWMYNFDNGVVNLFLDVLPFVDKVRWFSNPELALPAVIFALIWQFSGYTMVVYLAGLRAIPTEHYEAARVDGASTFKMYWRVIVPQLKGSTISATVVLMVFALKAFDFLYALRGTYLPYKGTDILATLMMREAFSNGHFAYAAAIGIMLFVLALGVVAPYLTYQYRSGQL
ncbi:carbohydrate ABC transporter permease [Halorubellus salinus]|uniref:carbohydrate ABC transporter permease n=1 Tax=Halorubellus salinus TaxID=755309 RepID=UPI001D095BC5|nr:sugar ABC transporter permease [Halorubellus salinus]